MVLRLFWGVVLAAAWSGTAFAQPAPPPSPAPPAAAAPPPVDANPTGGTPVQAKPSDAPLPSCLDQTLANQLGDQLTPRGVQKRTFLKRHKLVVVAHGGLYAGDMTSSSWIAGGSLGYFFTEDFGIQGEFDVTPLELELDAPLTKFFGDNRFQPGMAYVALGNAMWSPIHAKMKMGGGIVHADIMLFAGGGRMLQDAVQGITFDAGAALDLFVTKVVTIRFDLRDLMAVEEIAAEERFTNNVIATAGLAFWIPI
ncbi:MAG TPA: outer membrane beta-barrel domain-containing protein [Kofleriaceae bacterium]|nr:outer membrane beta-barrel domain-containing protein [Kofleriaceae bacterium]